MAIQAIDFSRRECLVHGVVKCRKCYPHKVDCICAECVPMKPGRWFTDLREANVTRQKLYGEAAPNLSLSYWGNAIAGETGELCNLLKKLDREAMGLKGSRAKIEDVADEIADVYIYLDLLCDKLGITQADAIATKFNKTSEKLGMDVFMGDGRREPK